MLTKQDLSSIRSVVKEEIAENQKINDAQFASIDDRFAASEKRFTAIEKTLKYIKKKVKNLDEFRSWFDKELQLVRKRVSRIEEHIKLPSA